MRRCVLTLPKTAHGHVERAVRLHLNTWTLYPPLTPSLCSAGFGWNYGSMDYGEDWRVCRKMTHHEFNATSFKKYRPVLVRHAHDLLRRLANGGGDRLPVHLKQYVAPH